MEFVGQTANKQLIDEWRMKNNFPRFIVISGNRGSGKTLLAKYIQNSISAYTVDCELDVDSVRNAIKNAYKLTKPCIYVFENAHNMSLQAKNALLKVTEEPPNNAYFILTTISMDRLLPTLKSRSVEIVMDKYTDTELLQCGVDNSLLPYIAVPGQSQYLTTDNVKDVINLCDNIIKSLSNIDGITLGLCKQISFKSDDEGYDIDVIINVLKKRCLDLFTDGTNNLIESMNICIKFFNCINDYKHLIDTSNVNKSSAFDVLLFKLSDIYRKEYLK